MKQMRRARCNHASVSQNYELTDEAKMENGQVYWHMQKEKRRKGQYSDDDTCILLDMGFFLFFLFEWQMNYWCFQY